MKIQNILLSSNQESEFNERIVLKLLDRSIFRVKKMSIYGNAQKKRNYISAIPFSKISSSK